MNKYMIDGELFEGYLVDFVTDEIEEDYDAMLDECYGEVDICGYTYSPSEALYKIDRIAYDCGLSDYADSVASDLESEIEMYGEADWHGYTIEEVKEEEEEEEEEE